MDAPACESGECRPADSGDGVAAVASNGAASGSATAAEVQSTAKSSSARFASRSLRITGVVSSARRKVDEARGWLDKHGTAKHRVALAVGHSLVVIYLAFAVAHWRAEVDAGRASDLEFCDGLGLLLVILAGTYLGIVYYALLKPYCFPWARRLLPSCTQNRVLRWTVLAAVLIALLVLLLLDIGADRRRLAALLGVVVFVLLGWACSRHPRRVRWRPVLTGLLLQLLCGLLTIRLPQGRRALECLAAKVAALLGCADDGSSFLFGDMLVKEKSLFAFKVLPVIFFFSSLIQVLYYLGAMQWVVARVGGLLQAIMGTTLCESVNAAGSVFLGMTESPLLIKPYIERLTSSELHAVMGTGFATASGSVLAAYISFGADPGNLLTASIMSATGALAYSKLLLPETEESTTTAEHLGDSSGVEIEDSSVIDAAARGASAGINIVLNIAANLVAFVSLRYLINSVVGWLGELVGIPDFSIEMVLGVLFMPVVWLMGVAPEDCKDVATLVGLKTFVNEFVAFERMSQLKETDQLSPRSLALSTLVLCGFANFGSLAILMSVLSAIAPSARSKVSDVALRSLAAGIVTCCITASMAGMLMGENSFSTTTSNETSNLTRS
ncbi:solute carrier family 28 member 3-like [Frankliniella occidentalis]|uniref:Sodium/nucleoside cotransporter n=1 Tax=Frankliniella occidentalis TaxID=133901 RepID=A0A9C6U8G2_FRAOC|nr:solute carrier family 28 member 3-like [Frankliniella occidentalis]